MSEMPSKDKPWVAEDGGTDVDGFLRAYQEDNNVYWMAETGHIQNVLDELIDRLDRIPKSGMVMDQEALLDGTGRWGEQATRNTEEYYDFQPGQKVGDPSVTDKEET